MKKIELSPAHAKILAALPEQGMGYQLVDIELNNGHELKNRIILNSTYLQLHDDETIDADDIKTIKLHKPKSE